ncbi:MAG TPA: hypothetical protein VGE31_01130 [Candidatus Paceibacterota bacterium]
MPKIALLIATTGVLIGLGLIFLGDRGEPSQTVAPQSGENVEIRDGVQYITIEAKGGYSPRSSAAKADIPTKLSMKTNGTYDCSAALVIRSIGYQKVLPQSGEEVIDLGIAEKGSSLQGTCSMGMYNFSIAFN